MVDRDGDIKQRYWSGAEIMLALSDEREAMRNHVRDALNPVVSELAKQTQALAKIIETQERMEAKQDRHSDRLRNVEAVVGIRKYAQQNNIDINEDMEHFVESSITSIVKMMWRNNSLRVAILAAISTFGSIVWLTAHSIYKEIFTHTNVTDHSTQQGEPSK